MSETTPETHLPETPSDAVFRLMSEAERLLKRRRDSRANYEAMRYDLYADERAWLEAAFDPEGDDPVAWVGRHPTLLVPLLEAYPLIRAAYPTERLLLARTRRDVGGHEDVEECHILDEEWEQQAPEIVVDREWFGEFWVAFAPEAEIAQEAAKLPVGGEEHPVPSAADLAMRAEDGRLGAVLGDDEFGRAEHWWGRDGAHGGYRIAFTPWCADDFLDTDLVSDEELAHDAAHERELLAQPPEVFAPSEEDPEGWSYQPGSAEYLAAVEAEIARRAAQGLRVPEPGLPLNEEEEALTERWMDALPEAGADDPLSPEQREALERDADRLHAARVRRLYAERERRRADQAAGL